VPYVRYYNRTDANAFLSQSDTIISWSCRV